MLQKMNIINDVKKIMMLHVISIVSNFGLDSWEMIDIFFMYALASLVFNFISRTYELALTNLLENIELVISYKNKISTLDYCTYFWSLLFPVIFNLALEALW